MDFTQEDYLKLISELDYIEYKSHYGPYGFSTSKRN